MAAGAQIAYLTAEEYLRREREADEKSEYWYGDIATINGVSRAHALVTTNVARILQQQVHDRDCEVYHSHVLLEAAPGVLYVYPDVATVVGKPVFRDREERTLTNPTALFEALSPTTAVRDRTQKVYWYRKLPSLWDYTIIDPERVWVERFSRDSDGQWLWSVQESIDEVLDLPSIGCRLPLAEVYSNVLPSR